MIAVKTETGGGRDSLLLPVRVGSIERVVRPAEDYAGRDVRAAGGASRVSERRPRASCTLVRSLRCAARPPRKAPSPAATAVTLATSGVRKPKGGSEVDGQKTRAFLYRRPPLASIPTTGTAAPGLARDAYRWFRPLAEGPRTRRELRDPTGGNVGRAWRTGGVR